MLCNVGAAAMWLQNGLLNPRRVSCCSAHFFLWHTRREEKGQHMTKAETAHCTQAAATVWTAKRCKGGCRTRSPTSQGDAWSLHEMWAVEPQSLAVLKRAQHCLRGTSQPCSHGQTCSSMQAHVGNAGHIHKQVPWEEENLVVSAQD